MNSSTMTPATELHSPVYAQSSVQLDSENRQYGFNEDFYVQLRQDFLATSARYLGLKENQGQ